MHVSVGELVLNPIYVFRFYPFRLFFCKSKLLLCGRANVVASGS